MKFNSKQLVRLLFQSLSLKHIFLPQHFHESRRQRLALNTSSEATVLLSITECNARGKCDQASICWNKHDKKLSESSEMLSQSVSERQRSPEPNVTAEESAQTNVDANQQTHGTLLQYKKDFLGVHWQGWKILDLFYFLTVLIYYYGYLYFTQV